MSKNYQETVTFIQAENAKNAGKSRVFCFVPHIEVFHLSKLLVPNVAIGIQMYFNLPALWSMRYGGAVNFRLHQDDIKVKLYLCQVRLNPSIYRELMTDMDSEKRVVSYPTVRSEIRTYNIQRNERHFEINNPFQNRLPNLVVIALVKSTAFNGTVTEYLYLQRLQVDQHQAIGERRNESF